MPSEGFQALLILGFGVSLVAWNTWHVLFGLDRRTGWRKLAPAKPSKPRADWSSIRKMELEIWGCTGETLDALLAGEPVIDMRLDAGFMTINEHRAGLTQAAGA